MSKTKSQIVRDVGLLLQASVAGPTDVMMPVSDSVTEALIADTFVDVAVEEIVSAPPSMLFGEAESIAENMVIDGDLTGHFPLPDDWLRIVALKLNGWIKMLHTPLQIDNPLYDILLHGCEGVRGSPMRPAMGVCATAKGWKLEFASAAERNSRVTTALIIRRPAFDAYGLINVPETSYRQIVNKTASKIWKQS